MNSRIFFSFLFFLIALPLFSQRTLQEVDENKYRISLPDHWSTHSKAFQVLTDVLPGLCPELKQKDICGDDCNPAWRVEFYLTEPELLYYEINSKPSPTINTNTQVSFVRKDMYISRGSPQMKEIGNNLTDRQLNNMTGKEIVSYFNFQCFLLLLDREQRIVTRLILVDTNEVWKKVQSVKKSINTTGTPGLWNALLPGSEELMAVADKKILALGKENK